MQGDWTVAAQPPSAPASARKLALTPRLPSIPASHADNTNKFLNEVGAGGGIRGLARRGSRIGGGGHGSREAACPSHLDPGSGEAGRGGSKKAGI